VVPGPEELLHSERSRDERVVLTVDRLDDGEVSTYLTDELMAGDMLELRGPVGGWFVWEARDGGPLLLVGGGVGRGAADGDDPPTGRPLAGGVPTRLLLSSRSYEEIIYREELASLSPRTRRWRSSTR
jgi:ferredoxin-NADP reductase